MYVDGAVRNIRAALRLLSGVVGNVKSTLLSPVNTIGYKTPWPGKLPANGVKPWM